MEQCRSSIFMNRWVDSIRSRRYVLNMDTVIYQNQSISQLASQSANQPTNKLISIPAPLVTKNSKTFPQLSINPEVFSQDPVVRQQCLNIAKNRQIARRSRGAVNSPSGVWGRAPAGKAFPSYLQPKKRTWWQQLWRFSSANTCLFEDIRITA